MKLHKIRITKSLAVGYAGLPRLLNAGEVYEVNQRQRDVLVSSGYAEDVKPPKATKKATNERKQKAVTDEPRT